MSKSTASALLAAEKAKWKRPEKSDILRLRQTVDKYKDELRKLHEDSMTADISYVRTKAAEKEPSALFLVPITRKKGLPGLKKQPVVVWYCGI